MQYPRVVEIIIIVPYLPPQTIRVRQLNPMVWRFTMRDRWGRIVNYEGSRVGYDVRLFRSTDPQHLSHFAVQNEWEHAIYRSADGVHQEVDIISVAEIKSDDQ